MTDTITVRLFGRELELEPSCTLAQGRVYYEAFPVYLGPGVILHQSHVSDDWVADFCDYSGHGQTIEEAAANLEAKLMPLARLLAPMVDDSFRRDVDALQAMHDADLTRGQELLLKLEADPRFFGTSVARAIGDLRRQVENWSNAAAIIQSREDEALAELARARSAKPLDNRSTFLRHLEEQEQAERDTDPSELDPMGGEF